MTLDRLGPRIFQDGTKQEITVEDDNAIALLSGILKEMRIMNLHLNAMTDNEFTKQDVN